MIEQELTYLLQQYLEGRATPEELEKLTSLLLSDPNAENTKDILQQLMMQETPVFPANRDRWQQIQQEIIATDIRRTEPLRPIVARTFKLYRRAAAAAILLLIGVGTLFLLKRSSLSTSSSGNALAASIISTLPGETREIVLADGSRVWLNAASSISIPASFGSKDRTVKLTGEAFFDVIHTNNNLPFRIHSGHVLTTVLGTAFDIKAYPEQEHIAVAVQRGKVKVQLDTLTLAILEKGRQVSIHSASVFTEKNTDSSSVASWRSGNLIYKDELLQDIVADLQRTFKDSIRISSPLLQQTRMTISFDKKNGLPPALDMICRATDKQLALKHGIYIIE